MKFQRGQWIIDKRSKKPFWVTALALEGTLLMGWCVKQHIPVWCTSSTLTDSPRIMKDSEIAQYVESETDVEGMTCFKTIMSNPDDYMFKNATNYGKEDQLFVGRSIAKESSVRGFKTVTAETALQ